MERKAFIKQAALGTLAVSLLPGMVARAASATSNALNLPGQAAHIRHGLLGSSTALPTGWPAWITRFQRERFYQNGHAQSENDLQCCLLELNSKPVTISWNATAAHVFAGEAQAEVSTGTHTLPVGEGMLTLVRASCEQLDVATNTNGQWFAAVLEGALHVNNQFVKAGSAVQGNATPDTFQVARNSLILIMTQHDKKNLTSF